MFVRKKRNRSGSVSIVVVDKHGGRFKELHTVGIAKTDDEVSLLMQRGQQWIDDHLGVRRIDFDGADKKEAELANARHFLGQIDNVLHNGAKLMLDKRV